MSTQPNWTKRALRAIEQEATVCYDVAAEHGQMFENVRHMRWFVQAVAHALRPSVELATAFDDVRRG